MKKEAVWVEVEPGLYRRVDAGDREGRRRMLRKIVEKADSPLLREILKDLLQ